MNWLKHILVMIALLIAAAPCCHAAAHVDHDHDADAAAELCATHTCACHSCDAGGACAADYDSPQDRTFSTAVAAVPTASIQLFVHTEIKPVVHRAPPAVAGPFLGLRTVQLLI